MREGNDIQTVYLPNGDYKTIRHPKLRDNLHTAKQRHAHRRRTLAIASGRIKSTSSGFTFA